MSESSRPVTVHAWVDIACPWCWIAKRRFEEAAAEFGGEVVVDYHSWDLAPDLPESWVSSEVVFLQHLYAGTTAEDAAQKISAVRTTGVRLGLAYDFDAVQHTNTFRAHQLVHHAKAQGRGSEALDALFSAFFEQGRDVRGVDELVAVAGAIGLDPEGARASLEAGEYAESVRADRAVAGRFSVTGIPSYVIGDQPPILGARRPALLLEALRRASGVSSRG